MLENLDEKIDQYLLRQIKGAPFESFKEKMAADEQLASAVEQRKALIDMVETIGDFEIKKDIDQVVSHVMTKNRKPKLIKFWKYAAAAVFVLATGLCTWLWTKAPVPEKLFTAYYEPYVLNFTSRNTSSNQRLMEADQYYQSRDYHKALPLFESIYAEDTLQSKIELALGICQMEIGQFEKAFQHFSKLGNMEFNLYKDHGLWYAALVGLHQGEVTEAKKNLQPLTNTPSSPFYNKAKKLFSKL